MRVDDALKGRIDRICDALRNKKFVRVNRSQAMRVAVQRGLSVLESELEIAEDVDLYTYSVVLERSRFVATCGEFPKLKWCAPWEFLALIGVKELVREELDTLIEKGLAPPEPRRTCSHEDCEERADVWCECPRCMAMPVTGRRLHACGRHVADVDAEHHRLFGIGLRVSQKGGHE